MSGTDYTLTTTLGLYKPIANRAVGLWGDLWNTNADAIDAAIHFASGGGPYLPLAGNATVFGPAIFSGALNYTATGGSVVRSAQSRAADVANVLDFGADPTGVADSTTAIRSALAATPRRSVYLPSGSYRITDSLTVGAGPVSQTLYGDGQASVLLVGTDFSASALGVVILTGRQSQLATHPVVRDLTIQFAVPTDITAALASASGTTLTLTAPVPAGVVVGDYVTDDTDWSGVQVNSTTMNSNPPVEGSKVVSIAGSTVTISLPVVAGHIAAGHTIRFGHTRSMFRNLGAAPPPSTAVGGYGAKYPWAIYATNCGLPLIQNIKINGAWNGIYLHPAAEGGGFRIKDCPIGAMNVGVDIDEGADGGFMENVWFNAYGIYVPAFTANTAFGQVWYDGQTVSWSIGKTDGVFMSNIGSFNCKAEIKPTWSFGQIVNINQDFPSAWLTIGAHTGLLQISNFRGEKVAFNGACTMSNFLIDGSALPVPFMTVNGSQIQLVNGGVVALVPGGVVVSNGGTMHVQDTIISGPNTNWSGGLIQVQTGNAIDMRGCNFVSGGAGPGLTLASDNPFSTVWGNTWGNSTFTPPGTNGLYEGQARFHTSFRSGIDFNNDVTASGPTDLSKGINFFGGTYGIGITPNRVNIISANNVVLMSGGTDLLTANPTGVTCSVPLAEPALGGIVAAGTNAATATAIAAAYSNVSTTAAGTGVVLPALVVAGRRYVVWNHGANALNVWPGGSESILGSAGALVVAANAKAVLVSFGGTWLQED